MDDLERKEASKPDACKTCKHVHRGVTRETDYDQCGFPWTSGNSIGWCQCRSEPGQVLLDGSVFQYRTTPREPNSTCRACGHRLWRPITSTLLGMLRPCPKCGDVDY